MAVNRRTIRLVMTPITLLILCGILGYGAWWGYKQVTAPLPGKAPTPCVTTSLKELTTKQVVVRVLNGGYVTGLGGKISQELSGYGFTMMTSGNTQERVKKTIVVAASEKAPEAVIVASFFKDATIRADKDRAIDARVDVLVGSEFGGTAPEAPQKLAVPAGTACVAVPPSARTPSASGSGSPAAKPTK